MKNLDVKNVELREQINTALTSGDDKAISEAFVTLANNIEASVLAEARSVVNVEMADRSALALRGQAQLTSEERTYYNQVIEKRGFEDVTATMPKTIFDRVFEDLHANHPLLSAIDFVNATGSMEWVSRTDECVGAVWGALNSAITKELENGFVKENVGMYKLSAFIPVSKDMLDLGAAWLDRFVRGMLSESIAIALEAAIVSGTGKNQPVGMIKDLEGAVTNGVYPDKAAVVLNDLSAASLGKNVVAPLTKGGKRTVNEVLIVVNPLDYWGKIFPATTMLNAAGQYVHGVLPIPAKVVQSCAVAEGTMIAGVASDYFMALGSSQKIEYSDQYHFLEDERTYLTKIHGNGKPKDNKSFLVFNIAAMGVEATK